MARKIPLPLSKVYSVNTGSSIKLAELSIDRESADVCANKGVQHTAIQMKNK